MKIKIDANNKQQTALIRAAYPNWNQEVDLLQFYLSNKQALELASLEMTRLNWSAIYIGEYPEQGGDALVIQTALVSKEIFAYDVGLVSSRLLGHRELKVKVTSKPELCQIFVFLGTFSESSRKANRYYYADYLQWILGLDRPLYPAEIANVVFNQTYLDQAQAQILNKIEAELDAPSEPLFLILDAVHE